MIVCRVDTSNDGGLRIRLGSSRRVIGFMLRVGFRLGILLGFWLVMVLGSVWWFRLADLCTVVWGFGLNFCVGFGLWGGVGRGDWARCLCCECDEWHLNRESRGCEDR